jgi:hypothetical protein
VVQFHPIPLTKKQIIMERQELIDFLRENLTVEITTSRGYDFGIETVGINVSIGILNENGDYEVISSSDDYINVNN